MVDYRAFQLQNTSSLDEDIRGDINSLEKSYINFNKAIEGLSAIDVMPLNEFKHSKAEFLSFIQEIEDLIKEIDKKVNSLSLAEIKREDLRKRSIQILQKVKKNFNTKISDYNCMKKSIEGRQSLFRNENTLNDPLNPANFDSHILFKNYSDSKEHNDRKRKELESIKQTSAQLASLSSEFQNELEEQGEKLSGISDNVYQVSSNIEMGEKEIRDIDRIRQGQTKKVFILISACLIFLFFIIYLITKIFS